MSHIIIVDSREDLKSPILAPKKTQVMCHVIVNELQLPADMHIVIIRLLNYLHCPYIHSNKTNSQMTESLIYKSIKDHCLGLAFFFLRSFLLPRISVPTASIRGPCHTTCHDRGMWQLHGTFILVQIKTYQRSLRNTASMVCSLNFHTIDF